jgi:hypothetical protein
MFFILDTSMVEPSKSSSNTSSIPSLVSSRVPSTPIPSVSTVVKQQSSSSSVLLHQQSQSQQQPQTSQFEITSISCSTENEEKEKSSRFRRVKIDTTTKRYNKGRWNIIDSYDDSDAATKTNENLEASKNTNTLVNRQYRKLSVCFYLLSWKKFHTNKL